MATVTGVSLSMERKIGLPNYSSVTFWASATAQVDEADDANDVLGGLTSMLSLALDEAQAQAGASKPGVTVVERILGRPVM